MFWALVIISDKTVLHLNFAVALCLLGVTHATNLANSRTFDFTLIKKSAHVSLETTRKFVLTFMSSYRTACFKSVSPIIHVWKAKYKKLFFVNFQRLCTFSGDS